MKHLYIYVVAALFAMPAFAVEKNDTFCDIVESLEKLDACGFARA